MTDPPFCHSKNPMTPPPKKKIPPPPLPHPQAINNDRSLTIPQK